MNKKAHTLLFLALAGSLATLVEGAPGEGVVAAKPAVVPAPALSASEVIRRVSAANESLKSWSARFVERRLFVHFDYSETRSGRILFARDRGFRVDVDEPSSVVAVVTSREARMWEPKTNQLHIYKLQEELPADRLPIPLPIGKGGWDPARDHTVVVVESSDPEVVLELTPRDESSTYQKKTIWLDSKTWLPVKLQLVERTDDIVHFAFSEERRDAAIDAKQFELKVPANAEIMEHSDLPSF